MKNKIGIWILKKLRKHDWTISLTNQYFQWYILKIYYYPIEELEAVTVWWIYIEAGCIAAANFWLYITLVYINYLIDLIITFQLGKINLYIFV